MILYELCLGSLEKEFFHLEINMKHFINVMSHYKLEETGICKEYIINDTLTTISDNKTLSYQIEYSDTDMIDDHLLIRKDVKEIEYSLLSTTDCESKYILYESKKDEIHILCKKYPKHFTLSFECNEQEKIKRLLKTLKNIYY